MLNATARSLADRALEIISDPESWTQRTAARDHLLRPVSPVSEDAAKYCAFGALRKAAQEQGLPEVLLTDLFPLALGTLVKLNDQQGHAAVLKFLQQLANP